MGQTRPPRPQRETTTLEVRRGLDPACSPQPQATQMSPSRTHLGLHVGTDVLPGWTLQLDLGTLEHSRAPRGTAEGPGPGAPPQQVWTQTFAAVRSEGQRPLMAGGTGPPGKATRNSGSDGARHEDTAGPGRRGHVTDRTAGN